MPDRRMPAPLRLLARDPAKPYTRALHAAVFGRRFGRRSRNRLLILFEPHRISYASVYPFLQFADGFARRFDAQIRLCTTQRALEDGLPAHLAGATHVLAQSWLTDPVERHQRLAALLAALPAGCRTAFLDSSANADIRLAAIFRDVDLYFKKSLFADRAAHLRETYGDTNLTEYYGRLLGIPQTPSARGVPADILPKLRVAPNFLTAPYLAQGFLARAEPPRGARPIDLHARLGGTEADGWYGAMRRMAAGAAEAAGGTGLRLAAGSGIRRDAFMAELAASKMCFSPFGYGELCWRDMEAILAGAVLLKPDMSHLDTCPDLYRDGQTYVALKWDFSDLAEKAAMLMQDPERCETIARTAYAAAHDYLRRGGPVEAFAPLFA